MFVVSEECFKSNAVVGMSYQARWSWFDGSRLIRQSWECSEYRVMLANVKQINGAVFQSILNRYLNTVSVTSKRRSERSAMNAEEWRTWKLTKKKRRIGQGKTGNDFMLRNMETEGGSQDSESVTIGIRRVVVRVCLLLENSRDR